MSAEEILVTSCQVEEQYGVPFQNKSAVDWKVNAGVEFGTLESYL